MSDTRAADGTGTPVPVVPPSAGPRIFVVLSVVVGLCGMGFLAAAPGLVDPPLATASAPRRPWVLRSRDRVGAFSHGWWRKKS